MRIIFFLSMFGLFYSCNPQEEYYPSLKSIAGADQFCAEAHDLNSCQIPVTFTLEIAHANSDFGQA